MDSEKKVDEGWKDSVAKEKSKHVNEVDDSAKVDTIEEKKITETTAESPVTHPHPSESETVQIPDEVPELNFVSYISSLVFQVLIFLGDMPNPLTNQTDKNLKQAKFLIDTITLIKEKTEGNLTKEENEMLNRNAERQNTFTSNPFHHK